LDKGGLLTFNNDDQVISDPLTQWVGLVKNILLNLDDDHDIDEKSIQELMLALMQALDCNQLDIQLRDGVFLENTEALLLALLRGAPIEVNDVRTYAARREIFAAAQVIYNQAIARGFWPLHPEFRAAIKGDA
jgi:hypothetical protein